MIDLLLLAMLAKAEAPYEPPPAVFYPQAVGCAVSTLIANNNKALGKDVPDLMTWSMIVADMGRKAGRTAEQVESESQAALPYFRYLKEKKPKAFAAHLAYCRAMFHADRP
ncbi:MAG TPA: hypothetical protein VGA98_03050 [Allosphingosinicella sp.]